MCLALVLIPLVMGCASSAMSRGRAVPTYTPAPQHKSVERGCSEFTSFSDQLHEMAVSGSTKRVDIGADIHGLLAYFDSEPRMATAVEEMRSATLEFSGHQMNFQQGIIASRQLARLCKAKGYSAPDEPDIVMEYACAGPFPSYSGVNPSLRGYFNRCD